MKFQKDKDEWWSIITKNYRTWLSLYHHWWDWALPLHINVEFWNKDYTNIYLHILFFTFDFTRISHKYSKKLDTLFKDKTDEKN